MISWGKIAPYLSESAIVTDVGSVKYILEKLPVMYFFVPAHFQVGTENSGPSVIFTASFEIGGVFQYLLKCAGLKYQ